jgi:hypothetical protein
VGNLQKHATFRNSTGILKKSDRAKMVIVCRSADQIYKDKFHFVNFVPSSRLCIHISAPYLSSGYILDFAIVCSLRGS